MVNEIQPRGRDDGPKDVQHDPSATASPQNTSIFKRIWTKLGLNGIVFIIMVKPALAATVAMAIYQRSSVAKHYLNFGYLIIITSITTVPILPRGKFLLNLILSLFLVCFAAAMVLLGQWAAIKARQHTTPVGASAAVMQGYNSSASVVNAIFLMINIFGISVLRASRPAFGIPAIQFTVFTMVGFTYGPLEATEAASQNFLKELLYSFLTGQAISTGVSLFIIPVSSRKVFFAEATGFLQTCRSLLKAQLAYVELLEHSKPQLAAAGQSEVPDGQKTPQGLTSGEELTKGTSLFKQKAIALNTVTKSILALAAKLHEDVTFARREIAFGYLCPSDIQELYHLMRDITVPICGLSAIADISDRFHNSPSDAVPPAETQNQATITKEEQEWQEMIQTVTRSFEGVVETLDESLLHVLILLKLSGSKKRTKANGRKAEGHAEDVDIENGITAPKAGEANYGDYLERRIDEFRIKRSKDLQLWAEERGLSSVFQTTAKEYIPPPDMNEENISSGTSARARLASKRLHLVLYMEFLLYSVSKTILAFIRFAELKVNDGTLAKQRFIFPTLRIIRKLIKDLFTGNEPNTDLEQVTGSETVHLGDSFHLPKDPEHLPPKNTREVWGNHLRKITQLLGSAPARFAARVTIATMSIGIMAYLKNTHVFFIQQRIVWAMVMIPISMNPTAGSAVFNLLGNLTFSLVGMIGAFINWYIVDQKTPGVIVFFFLIMMFYFYFAARFPRFLIPIVAGALTHVLIIGYELQTRVIGLKIATATGQPFYPIYELAPYRLLTVMGGVTVAFIWTIFPVPITEASVLRSNLGISLFLLANYLSSVTATVDSRLTEKPGHSGANMKLEKMRRKVLSKEIALLVTMRKNLAFLAFEPRLGGEFPKQLYQSIVDEVQNGLNYLTIIAYASNSFTSAHLDPTTSSWLSKFARSRSTADSESNKVTSLLALLSASIRNGQALPPYLKAPINFRLSDELVGTGTHVLDLNNINEPGFRAVAVIEVAQRCLVDSVDRIVGHVKELVGEVDFSYYFVGSSEASSVLGKIKEH